MTTSITVTDGASDVTKHALTIDGHLGSAAAQVLHLVQALKQWLPQLQLILLTGVTATAVTFALINNLNSAGTVNFTLTTDDASAAIVSIMLLQVI